MTSSHGDTIWGLSTRRDVVWLLRTSDPLAVELLEMERSGLAASLEGLAGYRRSETGKTSATLSFPRAGRVGVKFGRHQPRKPRWKPGPQSSRASDAGAVSKTPDAGAMDMTIFRIVARTMSVRPAAGRVGFQGWDDQFGQQWRPYGPM